MRHIRSLVLLAVPFLLVAATGGCEEEEKATPQAIFEGHIESGTGNNCSDSGDIFTVGTFGASSETPSRPIPDGERFDQGTVSVGCSVVAVGADEFQVQGQLDLSGATGGFFRIDGRFKGQGEQTNIHASFSSRRTGNTYEQKDRQCIVRFTPPQGVAAGRVWGEITCPHAENEGAQKTCEAVAQFRFENCSQ